MGMERFIALGLFALLASACRRSPETNATLDASAPPLARDLSAAPSTHDAGAAFVLAGVSIALELPAGVGMAEGTSLLRGDAGFGPQTVDDGVVMLESLGRQVGVPEHTRSWTLDVTRAGPIPASLEAAKALALEPVPHSPAQVLLGAEALPGGGFLVSTRSADRIFVMTWHPNEQKHVECTGEDLREDPNGASWLTDPAQLQAARIALEAPCRSLRVLR